ncbi:MAG: hypothetical protein H3C31_02290 [Brumimicrobium sp.]|nr:hypothetical protein [Brumimicrobium sp.]MCO5269736.1 hypothetical protein [Brumimicrobium sp.]
MNTRLRIISAIGEAIIPLMGMLFFNWGIYFILLFYFLDLLTSQVFLYLKVKKIIQFQGIKYPYNSSYGRILVNNTITVSVILIAHLAVFFIEPGIDFYTQFIDFLAYEEAGMPIPQGYILLPIVILGNWQQYKMLFIRTGRYQVLSWKNIILENRKLLWIALGGGVTAVLISYFIPIPYYIYILAIIGVKFWFDWKKGDY